MPKMRQLPCLHRYCPLTFKSQHGRTYHIRSAHGASNYHLNNTDNAEDSANNDLEAGGDTVDVVNDPAVHAECNEAPSGPSNTGQTSGQRIEHPYLTGIMSAHCTRNSALTLLCDEHSHVTLKGTTCRTVSLHHPEQRRCQRYKGIGRLLRANSSSKLRICFTVELRCRPQTSMRFLSFGQKQRLNWVQTPHLRVTIICTRSSTPLRSAMSPGNVW